MKIEFFDIGFNLFLNKSSRTNRGDSCRQIRARDAFCVHRLFSETFFQSFSTTLKSHHDLLLILLVFPAHWFGPIRSDRRCRSVVVETEKFRELKNLFFSKVNFFQVWNLLPGSFRHCVSAGWIEHVVWWMSRSLNGKVLHFLNFWWEIRKMGWNSILFYRNF